MAGGACGRRLDVRPGLPGRRERRARAFPTAATWFPTVRWTWSPRSRRTCTPRYPVPAWRRRDRRRETPLHSPLLVLTPGQRQRRTRRAHERSTFPRAPADACRLVERRPWVMEGAAVAHGSIRVRAARAQGGVAGGRRPDVTLGQFLVSAGAGPRERARPLRGASRGALRRSLPRRSPARRGRGRDPGRVGRPVRPRRRDRPPERADDAARGLALEGPAGARPPPARAPVAPTGGDRGVGTARAAGLRAARAGRGAGIPCYLSTDAWSRVLEVVTPADRRCFVLFLEGLPFSRIGARGGDHARHRLAAGAVRRRGDQARRSPRLTRSSIVGCVEDYKKGETTR